MIRSFDRSAQAAGRGRLGASAAVLACAALLAAGCAASGGAPAASAPAAGVRRTPASVTATAGQRAGTAAPAASSGQPATPGHPATRQPPSRQLVTVTAAGYGDTWARLSAYQWGGGRWRRVFGPWPARLGRGGLAPPGGKREGDGRTPSGTFGLPFLFGTGPDPGFAVRYRRSRPWTAWDDDPASPRYNEWVDTRHRDPGASPEPMDVPAYGYGAVIGYNTRRVPGLGSAIFLHASIGIATAGCVTLPVPRLLRVLHWLDPRLSPRIRLGVG